MYTYYAMKKSLSISKDLKSKDLRLILEAAGVLVVGGIIFSAVSALSAESALKSAGNPGKDNIVTAPATYKESANIKVATPKDGDTLTSPFLLSGQARVFEAVVNFRLKDGTGKVLVEGTAKTKAGQTFSPFTYSVAFSKPGTPTGTLEVFQKSAQDGSDQDLVSISVKF